MLLRSLMTDPSDSGSLLDPASWLVSALSDTHMTAARAGRNSNVYTCVSVIADDIGKLPIHTFKLGGDRDAGMKHPVAQLLYSRPNPFMSSFKFWQTLEYHVGLYGNGIAMIEWGDDGYPKALWPLDPLKTSIRLDIATGKLIYKTQDAAGHVYELSPMDVIHRYDMSRDGLIGVPKWTTLVDELDSQDATKRFISKFYKNGTLASGILQTDGVLTPEAKEKAREEWSKLTSGDDNMGKTAILDMKMDYKPIGMQLDQAQFLETQKFGINEVAKVYKVPPYKLAQLDDATYSNAEAMALNYIKTTLLPIFTAWEQEINFKLFTPKEQKKYYVKFNAAAELRGDAAARAQYYKDMLYTGVYSINEIREMEEMTGLGDLGDIHFASLNYTPLDTIRDLQMTKAGETKGGDGNGDSNATNKDGTPNNQS